MKTPKVITTLVTITCIVAKSINAFHPYYDSSSLRINTLVSRIARDNNNKKKNSNSNSMIRSMNNNIKSPTSCCRTSTILTVFSSSHSNVVSSFDITSSIYSTTHLLSSTASSSGVEGLSSTTNTIIFVLGLIPFLWATYEFWSRIAVGKPFGTGSDSVLIERPNTSRDDDSDITATKSEVTTIGTDNDRLKSRGRRVLGQDALIVAYILFAIATASVILAIYSVVSSAPPPSPGVSTSIG